MGSFTHPRRTPGSFHIRGSDRLEFNPRGPGDNGHYHRTTGPSRSTSSRIQAQPAPIGAATRATGSRHESAVITGALQAH
ncbi:hypothetical protein GCM10009789_43490 [Kribbella sancticallisti]|uniref:Uncharacterized protein n=1 Tax=Kribbella sancticallisti TaxID=460087 RepID=A0ABP4PPC2_9ACTN